MTPELLTSIRDSLQWTQEQAAAYLDISRSQYNRMENGETPIRKVYAIAMIVKAPKTPATEAMMKEYGLG